MKLVIEIPDKQYERIDYVDCFTLKNFIKNGTPLEAFKDEKPRGKWILNPDGNYECSECGIAWKTMPTRDAKPVFKACPWCGANMGGDQE